MPKSFMLRAHQENPKIIARINKKGLRGLSHLT